MTVPESLLIALFCIVGVFLVLLCLCALIKLFSFVLGSISNGKKTEPIPSQTQPTPVTENILPPDGDFSSGTLRLKDVDEPTAAMIMAIVSDESGIPLSELCFKSIKLVRQD